MSKELTPYHEKAVGLREYLNGPNIKGTLAAALPKWLSVDRLLRIVFSSAMRNPRLLDCTRESILQSVMMCAQLGLEPILGRAYLIPYNNSKQIAGKWQKVMECQFQPGYQGLVDLARRSGTIKDVYAFNVYSNDDFSLSYGMDRNIHHVPWFMDPAKKPSGPGEFFGAYAVWLLKDGTSHPEFMHADDIFKRRDRSQAYQFAIKNPNNKTAQECPWIQWPEEMQTKTVLKHSSKMVPASIEFMQAVELDNQADMGIPQSGLSFDYSAISGQGHAAISDTSVSSDFSSEIAARGEKYPNPDMDAFIKVLADGQEMTADQVKAQIAAENDYDNFLAAFKKVNAATIHDANPTDRDAWARKKRGTPPNSGLYAHIQDNLDAFKTAWPDMRIDIQEELQKKYMDFYGEDLPWLQLNDSDPDGQKPEVKQPDHELAIDDDTMDRFNDIFTSKRGEPAWHYAQGEVTGDEKTTFRPKNVDITAWLHAYDNYNQHQGNG